MSNPGTSNKPPLQRRDIVLISLIMLVGIIVVVGIGQLQYAGMPVSTVTTSPRKYHLKEVIVVGRISDLQRKVSARRHRYYTCTLSEGKRNINVFAFGVPTVKNGDQVKAIGEYAVRKTLRPWVFENEIDATYGSVRKLTRRDRVLFTLRSKLGW